MRILSLNYETALGTAVHSTPVFAALYKLHPEWEVHVACAGITASLLQKHPGIHKMFVTRHPVQSTIKAAMQIANIGFRNKYDAVLMNTGNCRPRIAWNSSFIRSAMRIGVSTNPRFANYVFQIQEGKSVAANNLQVLKPLIDSIETHGFEESFEIYFGKLEKEKALRFYESVSNKNRPVVGFVTQTSGGQPSEWWDNRFIEVALQLYKKTGCRFVFFGTKQEERRIDFIVRQIGDSALSIAGETKIIELGAFVSACDLIISLDTGIMHIGRAVDVPMVVIAPAWQPAYEWLPLNNEKIKVLRRWDIGCRHCRKFTCATRECMDEISTAEVIAAALELFQTYLPNEQIREGRLSRWTIS